MSIKLNNEFLCNNLESRLVSLRKQKSETQGKVAEAIGVDVKTYAKYETGTASPNPEKLSEIAKIFNCAMEDLTNEPLKHRKEILNKIITNSPPNIIESSYVYAKGYECFKVAKKLNLEGIVAKDINSSYTQNRSPSWLKIKCYKRQEFVIGGYTTSDKNSVLSAILVGYYQKNKFIFVGKVGTGFSQEIKKELSRLFSPLKQKDSSFTNLKKDVNTVWLLPKLIAEIQYAELTKENLLRQPSFIGLRSDKSPKEVTLEIASD